MICSSRFRLTQLVLAGAFIGANLVNVCPLAANAATVSHGVSIQGCMAQRVVRPSSYSLGCGSGTYVITNAHWTGWGSPRAHGNGNYVLNTCTPTCAANHNASYRATFVVRGIRPTTRGDVYRSLTIYYRKGGHKEKVTWALPPFSG
jgi:hypothetical protein